MSNLGGTYANCRIICAAIAGGVGLVTGGLALGASGFVVAVLLAASVGGAFWWMFITYFCTPEPAAKEAAPAPAIEADDDAPPDTGDAKQAAAEPDVDAAPPAGDGGGWTDRVSASSGKASPRRGATGLVASAQLTEEATLRDRVGGWRYGEAPVSTGVDRDFDGDGVVEGADEGAKPATMSAAREGGPDDLKLIKGVGPKLEEMLHGLGFFHFDQIAGWTADEVAWVDANLEGFKGRVSRDGWVDQAKLLAAGEETEFSKKVGQGGVYDDAPPSGDG